MRSSIDRLTPLDLLMLGASRRWPQDIGALLLLDGARLLDADGGLRIDVVREAIASRLHLAPRFRQVVRTPPRGRGAALWVDDARFDIRHHVVVRPLPPGTDEPGLLLVTEELRREPFDPSRPLWRMWLLPGLPEGHVAMFVKLHHVIADGMAAMTTLASLLDVDPDAPLGPAPPWTPAPSPRDRDLVTDNVQRRIGGVARAASTLARPARAVRRTLEAWPAVRELFAEAPATRTSLDRVVGSGRRLAVIRTSLGAASDTAHAHHATVNDLLLALTAGGLRAVLRSRGEPIEETTLRTYVPVSLRRRREGPQQGNVIAQMAVPLPMRESGAADELRRLAGETAVRKARARASLGTLIRGRFARRLLLVAVMRQRVNVTTASIPGPQLPLHLCGAPVLDVVPVLPLIANEPIGVGALSYAGRLSIGVVADEDACPDLDVFVSGACAELTSLGVPSRAVPDVGGRQDGEPPPLLRRRPRVP